MANDNLTSTIITREALRVLHEQLSFVGTIDRQYDSRFANSGAKIGSTLDIRKPVKYTVRTGKTLDVQDSDEDKVTLTVETQKGVDLSFSSAELTMDIDDFSKRYIVPAMSVLASDIEADALQSLTKQVYNLVGTPGTTPNSTSFIANARAKLNQYLAPKDNQRYIQMDSVATGTMVAALQGLFHDSSQIADQYREGMMGRHGGFDWYENEKIYTHTNGSDVTGITLDSVTVTNNTSTVAITGASAAPAVGSVFTLADTYAVHPETKDAYGHLQQFVVTAATTSSLTFSPAIYISGPKQNVSTTPATTAALVWSGSASTAYEQHLAYHKNFATFATADLELPGGVDFAAREVLDGISMRIVKAYDINNDNMPCRIDVLYGYQALYPELACRITG